MITLKQLLSSVSDKQKWGRYLAYNNQFWITFVSVTFIKSDIVLTLCLKMILFVLNETYIL